VSAERRFADLESTLAQIKLDPAENAPLLALLLDIPLPPERAPTLAPDELRRRQLAALTAAVIASARVQPVTLAIEDLHWADPTTIDVVKGIAERGAAAPLFVLATTLPAFKPPWSIRSHHTTISLAPLDRAQVCDMITELSAHHALPREVVDDVASRTGGVPLFVEEVTRFLLERGEAGGVQAVPPTLQQSLLARLDRLGPAREVAQIGSVIGRGFSYGLLRARSPVCQTRRCTARWNNLWKPIFCSFRVSRLTPTIASSTHLFRMRTYEKLLKSRRQVLHRRVAETLRDRFPYTGAAAPEVLAHHFTQAGLTDAAIEWWGKAGEETLRRSAFEEAISHLGKAIEMADKTGEGGSAAATAPASANQRLKLLGTPCLWQGDFAGAPEHSSKEPSPARSKPVMCPLWSTPICTRPTSRWFAVMLDLSGATRKLSSNSAKRMRLSCMQLWAVAIRLGNRSPGQPRDRSDGASKGVGRVRRPRKQISSAVLPKGCLPRSKRGATQREP
jgi:predicted ATPase